MNFTKALYWVQFLHKNWHKHFFWNCNWTTVLWLCIPLSNCFYRSHHNEHNLFQHCIVVLHKVHRTKRGKRHNNKIHGTTQRGVSGSLLKADVSQVELSLLIDSNLFWNTSTDKRITWAVGYLYSMVENVQRPASKWILSWKLDYQNRTVPLHILTLVLYVQIMFC